MSRFKPRFTITPATAGALMQMEAAREAVDSLPITPALLAALRQSARLSSTHYSTRIEGNRLTQAQVTEVISGRRNIPGHKRDEREVLGYFAALSQVEKYAAAGEAVTEARMQQLHGLVMGGGRNRIKPTPYREGQNVIRDSGSGRIVYLPPEAADVPGLMRDMVTWLRASGDLPCPIRAGIAHYQFATIHPYYDGNGRTARLLTTLILHLGGYGLKGIYALEEYYARDLGAYYAALTVGPSHNYYEGRAEGDITGWVEYFCRGVAASFETVKARAREAAAPAMRDQAAYLRRLDPRQRRALELFEAAETITSLDVAKLFGVAQRTARILLSAWVESGFVAVADPAKKSRKYRLVRHG